MTESGHIWRFMIDPTPVVPVGGTLPTVGTVIVSSLRMYHSSDESYTPEDGPAPHSLSILLPAGALLGNSLAAVDFDGDGCNEGLLVGAWKYGTGNVGAVLAAKFLSDGLGD